MPGKFEIKKTQGGSIHFVLRAANSKVIFTSETYPDVRTAKRGIESVRKNASKDAAFEPRTATSGQPYFVLKAANREIIGHSETYSTKAAMSKGIASVRTHAADAVVVDMSTAS